MQQHKYTRHQLGAYNQLLASLWLPSCETIFSLRSYRILLVAVTITTLLYTYTPRSSFSNDPHLPDHYLPDISPGTAPPA